MTVVIGILGPAGSGKSAVAQHLVENYGAKRYSLAGPLKEIAKRVFEFSDEQLYGTQAQKEADDPRYNFSPRWLLQRLGTEGCRAVLGPNVWTDALMRHIKMELPELAVVDDVRFVNEANKIREGFWRNLRILGTMDEYKDVFCPGLIWRLESPWRETKADASHASEAEWVKCQFDYRIAPTEYGIEKLYALVDEACAQFGITRVG